MSIYIWNVHFYINSVLEKKCQVKSCGDGNVPTAGKVWPKGVQGSLNVRTKEPETRLTRTTSKWEMETLW